MHPDLQYHAVSGVVEEHHVPDGSAGELEGCFQDDRQWNLHEKRKGRIVHILEVEQLATQGTLSLRQGAANSRRSGKGLGCFG